MIRIFLSINNNEEVLQLPVPPPPDFTVPSPWRNEQMDGVNQTLNLIGMRGLRTIELSSFFPAKGHNYPFLQNRSLWGMEYINLLERWRWRRIPIRLVISDDSGAKIVNLPVTLDDIEHGMQQNGDISYTLRMTEFTFVDIKG